MGKKKILLVIDKRNWAYDQMASYVINELSNKYIIHKMVTYFHVHSQKNMYMTKLKYLYNRIRQCIFETYTNNVEYDLAVYMWWNIPQIIPQVKIRSKKELRGIFTESFPPGKSIEFDGSIEDFLQKYIKPANGIIAGNKNIFNFYENHDIPIYYATGSTDLGLFKYNRCFRDGGKLLVCWTGNPYRNFKGFFDYVVPAVELARQTHPDIRLITRFKGPLKTLPAFYAGVDIMINASIGDAGPGFIIDAGACGVPAISTDVGFASEIIKNYENGLIVDRNAEAIAQKIIEVYENRTLLKDMSINIAKDIHSDWGHKSRAKYWDEMFSSILGGMK